MVDGGGGGDATTQRSAPATWAAAGGGDAAAAAAAAASCELRERCGEQRAATSREPRRRERCGDRASALFFTPATRGQKAACALIWIAIVALCVCIFVVLVPRLLMGPLAKATRALRERKPLVVVVTFFGVFIIPHFVVLPAVPLVWLAGMVLPFWLALLTVMAAATCGAASQFLLARHVLTRRVEALIARRPRHNWLAVVLRAVAEAGPNKVVALLRLGPAPYPLLNYCLGIVPAVRFWPCQAITLVTETPSRTLQILFGSALPTLADLFAGKPVNPGIAAYQFVAIAAGIAFVVATAVYSRRVLKTIHAEELQREQQQQAEAAAGAFDAEEGGGGGGAREADTAEQQQQQEGAGRPGLALAVAAKEKEAAADADADAARVGGSGGSGGDLVVVVAGGGGGAAPSPSGTWIVSATAPPTPPPLPPPAAAVARDLEPDEAAAASLSSRLSSRLSSVSSMRQLLSRGRLPS